ncbi:MAG: hypothetical protein HYX85_00110 [Chloroflexi bacterium]|nr:hypothetical protein [Chloroflexota bacterium]
MGLERRVEKLEGRTGARKRYVIVVQRNGDESRYTRGEFDRALDAFIMKHGERDGPPVLYWANGQFREAD